MRLLMVLSVLMGANCAAQARVVYAEGQAMIERNQSVLAEQMAIREALKSAAMQHNVKVGSLAQTRDFQLTREAGYVQTSAQIKRYEVVEKTQEEGLIKVRLQVELSDEPGVCAGQLATHLRAKLVVVPFSVDRPAQVGDLYGLPEGLALQMVRDLKTQPLLVQTLSSQGRGILGLSETQRDVQSLARDLGVQWVMMGVVRDSSLRTEHDPIRAKAQDFWAWTGRPTAKFNEPNQRNLALEVFIYDGHTGELVFSDLKGSGWTGWVELSRDIPVGSPAFMQTPMGRQLTQINRAFIDGFMPKLLCQPLVTRVIGKDEQQVIVDLGAAQGVSVGDRLFVHRPTGFGVKNGARDLGQIEKPVGLIEITQVQAAFSLGRALDEGSGLQIGDVVKSW